MTKTRRTSGDDNEDWQRQKGVLTAMTRRRYQPLLALKKHTQQSTHGGGDGGIDNTSRTSTTPTKNGHLSKTSGTSGISRMSSSMSANSRTKRRQAPP